MRTNQFPNPSFEVDLSGFNFVNSTTTQDLATSSLGPGNASCKLVRLASGTVSATASGLIAANAGETWTVTLRCKTTSASSAQVVLTQLNAAGGTVTTSPATFPASATWNTVVLTVTLSATVVNLRLAPLVATAGAIGDAYWIDLIQVEKASQSLPYIDGDQINCFWNGTRGASASTCLSLDSTTFRTNMVTDPAPAALTTWSWGAGGGAGTTQFGGDATVPTGTGNTFTFICTTAATSGVTVFVSTAATTPPPLIGCSPGDVLSGSVWLKTTVSGQTWTPAFRFYDGTGTAVSTPTGTPVALTAGVWTRVQMTNITVPATATQVRISATSSGTLTGVGATLSAAGATIEAGSVAGSWFSGDSVNAVWYGTANASESQQLNLTMNPNWPTLDFRSWVQDNPFAPGGTPTMDPLILTDRARELSFGAGRQYELDQDEATSGTLKVANNDSAVVGGTVLGNAQLIPMRYADFRCYWQGVRYDPFVGFVRSWPNQDSDPATGDADLEIVDLFEPLANRPMRSIIEETTLGLSVPPTAYFPLTDPAGSVAAGNIAPTTWPNAPLVYSKGGAYPSTTFGKQGFLADNSESCFTFQGAWTTAVPANDPGHGSQIQVSGPANTAGPRVNLLQPWAMSIWCRLDIPSGTSLSGTTYPMSFNVINKNSDNTMCTIELDWATAPSESYRVYGFSGVNSAPVTTISKATVQAPMHMVLGYDGTNAFFWFNGVKQTFVYSLAGLDNYSNYVVLGQFFQSQGVGYPYPAGNGSNQDLGHFALWMNSVPTDADVQAMFAGGRYAFANETPQARIKRVSGWAGQGTTLKGDTTADTTLGLMPDTRGSAALDVIRQAALDGLGRVVDDTGYLSFLGRNHNQTLTAPQWVLGSNTAGGELPYTGGPGFDFDPTHIYNDVQVTRTGGALARVLNQTSIGKFFTRVLQVSTNVAADTDANYSAQWLASRYANPQPRIRTLSIYPSSNPNLWPMALGAKLGDVVQVNHRMVGRPARSLKCRIQKISHTIKTGETWQVDYELTPEPDYWVLAAMHTTVKTAAASGVTTTELNPLPDSAYNPAEASIAVGTTMTLGPGTANEQTLTVKSVASVPTANTTGYTSFIVTWTTATSKAVTVGETACDPLPAGYTDPTTWDARSVLDSTTLTSY